MKEKFGLEYHNGALVKKRRPPKVEVKYSDYQNENRDGISPVDIIGSSPRTTKTNK